MRSVILLTLVVGFVATGARSNHTLSPAGALAFKQLEIQKDLDILRDVAHDANAQVPPLISNADTRKITDWHTAAVNVLHTAGTGWQNNIVTTLDEVVKNLPLAQQQLLAPYVTLVKVVVNEVAR